MATHVCLPDKRLIENIIEYRIAYDAIPPHPFFASSTFAFNLGGAPIRLDGQLYPAACLFCISSEPTMRSLQIGEGEIILVAVRPGALYRLFGLDGAKHGGRIVEADPNSFPQFAAIIAALAAAPQTIEGRVAALNAALIAQAEYGRPYGIGEKFHFAADVTKGNIKVEDAAERLGVSTRTLERDCRRRFGRTPKRILRGWRIGHAMSGLHSSDGPVRWNATDSGANYSDQSHFLRDHREIGGLNPTEMYEAVRALEIETICHPRSNLSVSRPPDDAGIAAEFEDNYRFRVFGSELARELNLADWGQT